MYFWDLRFSLEHPQLQRACGWHSQSGGDLSFLPIAGQFLILNTLRYLNFSVMCWENSDNFYPLFFTHKLLVVPRTCLCAFLLHVSQMLLLLEVLVFTAPLPSVWSLLWFILLAAPVLSVFLCAVLIQHIGLILFSATWNPDPTYSSRVAVLLACFA